MTDADFETFIRNFMNLVQDIKIYPSSHPEISKKRREVFDNIHHFLKAEREFSFAIFNDEIIFKNTPYIKLSETLPFIVKLFYENNFSKISFYQGLSVDELSRFGEILNEEGTYPSIETLKGNGIFHITCSSVTSDLEPNLLFSLDLSKEKLEFFQNAVEKLKKLEHILQTGQNLDYEFLISILNHLTPQVLSHYNELLFLGTLKSHSENSFEHVLNVAVLSCLLGAAIGLPEDILDKLCVAAFLHDIGKKQIPLDILNKPGKLNPAERTIMETHSALGAKNILYEGSLGELPAIVAFEHHLNIDETGYPPIHHKRKPHLLTRIVTIADFYDALRGTRVYSGEIAPEEVYEMMQDLRGKKFDPDLLDVFFHTIGVFPPGIEVELDTGEQAMVVKANSSDIFRPIVYLTKDKNGNPVLIKTEISLAEQEEGRYTRSIRKSIPPVLKEQKEKES